MALIVLAATLAALGGQAPARVPLDELTAHPERFAGRTVEIRAVLHVTQEPIYLCSDRLPPEQERECEPVAVGAATDVSAKERAKLDSAYNRGSTGKHNIWLTLRGRFVAAERPTFGWQQSFRYMFLVERVVRVETRKRRIARDPDDGTGLLNEWSSVLRAPPV